MKPPTGRHLKALCRLRELDLEDDGWVKAANAGYGPRVSVQAARALVRDGFAKYMPPLDSDEPAYVRITLAGIAALRNERQAA